MHYIPLCCTSSPCNLLFLNPSVYGLVPATVGVGTVLIWDCCVAYTNGEGGYNHTAYRTNTFHPLRPTPHPSRRFLDSDIWIHDQERFARDPALVGRAGAAGDGKLPYVLATGADQGPRIWRAWWGRHLAGSALFGAAPPEALAEWVPIERQVDWYAAHAKHCRKCRAALRRAERVRRWAPALAVVPVALGLPAAARVAGLAAVWPVMWLADRVRRSVTGPDRGDEYSAARMSDK